MKKSLTQIIKEEGQYEEHKELSMIYPKVYFIVGLAGIILFPITILLAIIAYTKAIYWSLTRTES